MELSLKINLVNTNQSKIRTNIIMQSKCFNKASKNKKQISLTSQGLCSVPGEDHQDYLEHYQNQRALHLQVIPYFY